MISDSNRDIMADKVLIKNTVENNLGIN
jgi:hypothetical protein